MASTREIVRKLTARWAEPISDKHIMVRARPWANASPAERMAVLEALCADTALRLSRLDPDTLEREMEPEPLPADTEALLMHIWQRRKR